MLDNYEHLLEAAEFAGALLQAAPAVTLLVTSRAPLRVRGEREYAVSPLPLPAAAPRSSRRGRRRIPAVALFRGAGRRCAGGLWPDRRERGDDCGHLHPAGRIAAGDRAGRGPGAGAAAGALLARLEQRLPVLTGGARRCAGAAADAARHDCLELRPAWEPAEQRLFRRLGVFAGAARWTLAEAVCNADGDLGLDVLDGVSFLVENSLRCARAVAWRTEPRYRMLETIREFALGGA